MAFLWSCVVKDLQRRLRDPFGLLLWLGIPFVILAILLLAFGGSGKVKPQARLLVADLDDSFLSGALAAAFGQGPLAELVLVEAVDLEEGRERIGDGDGSALLVIPAGFGDAVLSGGASTLELTTNPAQRILPGIIEETLEVVVEGVFYARRLLGDELETVSALLDADTGPSNATLVQLTVEINEVVTRISKYLAPEPVISLDSRVEEEEQPDLNFGALFFQGMFFMAIVFMGQGVSDDVCAERSQGTLRRLVTTPQAISTFLGGKMLAIGVVFAAAATLVLPIGAWLYDFAWPRIPVAILWVTFSGLLLTTLFTMIQLFAASQRAGSILSTVILFPIIMIGGSFFPFEMMPPGLAAIGQRTPNGWALQHLKAILAGTATLQSMAVAFVALSAMGAAAFLISSWRIRRGFAQGV